MRVPHVLLLAAVAALLVLGILWRYYSKRKKGQVGALESVDLDIDLAIGDAEAHLGAAKIEQGTRVKDFRLFLLVGDSGSAKTSVVLQSGADPELLSGQVYENNDVIPTKMVNIWFARQSLFVEVGGTLLGDPEKWSRLVRRLLPRRSVIGKGKQPARSVIVLYDCQNLLAANSQEAASKAARNLRTRLVEMAQMLGADLPIYVLFTKMDRLPFFPEYATNFNNDEARQLFGVTVPMGAKARAGTYAEAETARLTENFDRLFRSLACSRATLLAREQDSTRLAPIYEFPREFRKVRPAAVQFLVDLCRPSQLTVGPFLRGFYFTGLRAVSIAEAPSARRAEPAADFAVVSRATQILLREAPAPVSLAPDAKAPHDSRRVPQWVFLPRLFNEVVLADRTAQGASAVSTKTNSSRRLLLVCATVLSLLFTAGTTVSFSRNRSLESRVRMAAVDNLSGGSAATGLPQVEALRRLETLRKSLQRLVAFRREGPPWSYRWELYTGNDLYLTARRLYFTRFRQLLLEPAQNKLLESLRGLPGTPGPEYGPTYDALKAYLITTSDHDRSTRLFLTPVLLKSWSTSTHGDGESQVLARKQFDFYAEELRAENPFATENDSAAIEKARHYLAQFAGTERVYAFMAADAAKHGSPVNFNRQFPGSAAVVLEAHEVAPIFSKAGWDFMRDALQHADRYFNGERWVLGDREAAQIDQARLERDLRNRYYADFVREWRLYIKSASVVPYTDVKDAAAKLAQISGNQSPLLALLSLVSQNTAVDDPAVAGIFQPVHAVLPPQSRDRYVASSNQNYINTLVTLQASLENVTGQADDPAAAQTLNNAFQAKIATRQMAQSFHLDNEEHIETAIQKLLEDPIIGVEQAIRGAIPAELNAGGKGMCTQMRALTNKFPFNSRSKIEATPADLNGVFRKPDGALWSFYEKSLKKVLTKQGGEYTPSGALSLNPAFVTFFNSAMGLSDALYAQGATEPVFAYTVKPGTSEGVQGITLRVDGQALTYAVGNPTASKTFTWQADATHDMTVNVRVGGADFEWQHHTGMWGVFRFFAEAKQRSGQSLEWPVGAGGQQFKADGKPVTVRLEVDMGQLRPIFQNGLSCVADVVR
jgi:type VI secretion system protein ImpL